MPDRSMRWSAFSGRSARPAGAGGRKIAPKSRRCCSASSAASATSAPCCWSWAYSAGCWSTWSSIDRPSGLPQRREDVMLDANFVRENLEAVKENCRNRNVTVDLDRVAALIDQRRQLAHQKSLNEQQANQIQRQVPQTQDPTIRQGLIGQGRA